MAGIRINSGVIRVEVNDKGDTISLRKDFNFINNITSFADGLEVLQQEFKAKAANIAEGDTEAQLDLLYETHKELHDALEGIFGVGTCKKVFGDGEVDVIPTMDAVIDFCEQISPYIVQIAESLGKTNKPSKPVAKPKGYMGGEPNRSAAFSYLRQQISDGDEVNEV